MYHCISSSILFITKENGFYSCYGNPDSTESRHSESYQCVLAILRNEAAATQFTRSLQDRIKRYLKNHADLYAGKDHHYIAYHIYLQIIIKSKIDRLMRTQITPQIILSDVDFQNILKMCNTVVDPHVDFKYLPLNDLTLIHSIAFYILNQREKMCREKQIKNTRWTDAFSIRDYTHGYANFELENTYVPRMRKLAEKRKIEDISESPSDATNKYASMPQFTEFSQLPPTIYRPVALRTPPPPIIAPSGLDILAQACELVRE